MTNEMVLDRTSNLVMPVHYVELDRDEMSYVDGGKIPWWGGLLVGVAVCVISAAAIFFAGVAGAAIVAKLTATVATHWSLVLGLTALGVKGTVTLITAALTVGISAAVTTVLGISDI